MRAPCQRVHDTGHRRGAKDAGIGLSDQGRPASGPAATQEAARENFRKLVRGASGRGAKVPHLGQRWLGLRESLADTPYLALGSTNGRDYRPRITMSRASQFALSTRLADQSTTPLRAI